MIEIPKRRPLALLPRWIEGAEIVCLSAIESARRAARILRQLIVLREIEWKWARQPECIVRGGIRFGN